MKTKTNQSVLTKQELFVHPISILQKQKSSKNFSNQYSQQPIEPKSVNQIGHQTFSELLLNAANSQSQNQNIQSGKAKRISKNEIILSSNAQTNKQKHYRTRMCPQGIQCKKRLVCLFAHTQFQLRRPYKNRKNPCIRYQKGLCSLGAACPDYHGNMDLKKKNYKYKSQKCIEWHQKGSCQKGKLCIYIHDELESEKSVIQLEELIQNQQEIDQIKQQIQVEPIKSGIQVYIVKQREQLEQNTFMKTNLKPKNIFSGKTEDRKPIIAKQMVQVKIQQKPLEKFNQNQDEQNFNIQFNF